MHRTATHATCLYKPHGSANIQREETASNLELGDTLRAAEVEDVPLW